MMIIGGGLGQLFLGARRRQLRKHVPTVKELLATFARIPSIFMSVSRSGSVGLVIQIIAAKTCSRTTRGRLKLLNADGHVTGPSGDAIIISGSFLIIIHGAQPQSIVNFSLHLPVILIVSAYFEVELIFMIDFLEIVIRNLLGTGGKVVHRVRSITVVRILAHS